MIGYFRQRGSEKQAVEVTFNVLKWYFNLIFKLYLTDFKMYNVIKVKQTFCCNFKIYKDEDPIVRGLNRRAGSEIKIHALFNLSLCRINHIIFIYFRTLLDKFIRIRFQLCLSVLKLEVVKDLCSPLKVLNCVKIASNKTRRLTGLKLSFWMSIWSTKKVVMDGVWRLKKSTCKVVWDLEIFVDVILFIIQQIFIE